MKSFRHFLVAVAITAIVLVGCAKLQPGADPLIVRAEQTEITALATFDLLLNTDDSNRAFYREKAPHFHAFAEWLRAPMPWGGTNLQRSLVLVHNLQNVKATYRKDRSNSNLLTTALLTIQSAMNQASTWNSTITTNPPAR